MGEGQQRKRALVTARCHEFMILPSWTVPTVYFSCFLPPHYFLLTYRKSAAEVPEDTGLELVTAWRKNE